MGSVKPIIYMNYSDVQIRWMNCKDYAVYVTENIQITCSNKLIIIDYFISPFEET